MITIEAPLLSHVSYIAANLRLTDQFEIEASFRNANVPQVLVNIVANSIPWSYVAVENGQPIFVYGVLVGQHQPHFGLAWGFGTSRASRAIPTVGEHIQKALIPQLLDAGLTRVEVRVVQDAKSSAHWLRRYMGAQPEATLIDQGVNGETFQQFAWTRTHQLRTGNVSPIKPRADGAKHGLHVAGTHKN